MFLGVLTTLIPKDFLSSSTRALRNQSRVTHSTQPPTAGQAGGSQEGVWLGAPGHLCRYSHGAQQSPV